jgi:hypothetical protein
MGNGERHMRVKVEIVGKGQHPNEAVARIVTLRGSEDILIDERSIQGGTIDVGFPISHKGNALLIELPSETASGSWRVWVDRSQTPDYNLEAAE